MSVHVEEAGPVLEITIDRPKANAIDAETSVALGTIFSRFRDEERYRVAIITGAGERFFCAGWDLKASAESGEMPDQRPGGPLGAGGFAGLTELPGLFKPVIAAVNGAAVGGGCEIALAADLVVAAEHASFAVPEALHGVLADAGGLQRLPRRVPRAIALEMLLTGRSLKASEALHFGLVNAVVPRDGLMERARAMAKIIAEAAPLAIQAVKQVVVEGEALEEAALFAAVRAGRFPLFDKAFHSEDSIEGARAFAEKRPPRFKGR